MSTDSVGQLADLLDIRFHSNPDGQSSSESDKYNQYKLIILAGICGAPRDPSTWRDLSLHALPDFWTKIRGMHGRNSCLRAFVEGYIADCPKASPWEYQFLLTMEMLTMICNLSFLWDNPDKWWQSRMKGMSIWSLAPQNQSAHGEAIERHQRMVEYEDTADNHRPGDQADSAKLTKPDPNAPTDRMLLFKWVDHTNILLTIFFGPECPLVKDFKILAHRNTRLQSLVNDTTEPAEDQSGVEVLGPALPSILKVMFDTDCTWEINWQKIDLSDGFGCMIISTGAEHNFAFQMPTRATNTDTFFMVPSSLQMGWKNSPAYFCVAMQTTRELVRCMLVLTINTGIMEPHWHKHHCQQSPPPQPKPEWQTPTDMTIMSVVFINEFCNGIAGPPN
jgi:hypothetical protein